VLLRTENAAAARPAASASCHQTPPSIGGIAIEAAWLMSYQVGGFAQIGGEE
jgi:hypothetical protein